jgi:hypothetical protein
LRLAASTTAARPNVSASSITAERAGREKRVSVLPCKLTI